MTVVQFELDSPELQAILVEVRSTALACCHWSGLVLLTLAPQPDMASSRPPDRDSWYACRRRASPSTCCQRRPSGQSSSGAVYVVSHLVWGWRLLTCRPTVHVCRHVGCLLLFFMDGGTTGKCPPPGTPPPPPGCCRRLAPSTSVLLLVIHHIATDGWSMNVLQSELAAIYSVQVSPPPRVMAGTLSC